MSDLAAPTQRSAFGPWALAGLVLAVASVLVWFLAGVVDDGLYALTGVLGLAGFASGLKARRDAKRAGAPTWPALVAVVVGGLLGGLVVAFSIAYIVSELV
jgi:hypothetical protein